MPFTWSEKKKGWIYFSYFSKLLLCYHCWHSFEALISRSPYCGSWNTLSMVNPMTVAFSSFLKWLHLKKKKCKSVLSTLFIWSDKKIGQTYLSFFFQTIPFYNFWRGFETLISQSPLCGSCCLTHCLFLHFKNNFISKWKWNLVSSTPFKWSDKKIGWTYFSYFFQTPPFR